MGRERSGAKSLMQLDAEAGEVEEADDDDSLVVNFNDSTLSKSNIKNWITFRLSSQADPLSL